ncbi:MAG: SelT/SelW/SelH family protein [Cytophagales bacterium]|nr:SelT/SelW/SelH family protein [Cytophagales bacterium]MDW8383571.1 SelT/SelW/SelH family protein [Flammeovirgaceae bacterium]
MENSKHHLIIEYCPKCGWLLRSAWIAQELLTTFTEELDGITLKPSSDSGTFRIYLNGEIFHDRKLHNGFPELISLKQKLRDKIAPHKSLGHTDSKKYSS